MQSIEKLTLAEYVTVIYCVFKDVCMILYLVLVGLFASFMKNDSHDI